MDCDDVDPIEEILAEPSIPHHLTQVLVGRGNHADIGTELVRRTHTPELSLLQNPQQLDLHDRGHFTDLVQKDCPVLRNLDEPLLVAIGPRETSTQMTEQF